MLDIPCGHSGSCKAQGFWGFCVGCALVNIYKQVELPTLVPETTQTYYYFLNQSTFMK